MIRLASFVFVPLLGCGAHAFDAPDAGDAGQGGDGYVFGDAQPSACADWTIESFDPGPDGVLGTPDDVLKTRKEVQSSGAAHDGVAASSTIYEGSTIIQQSRVVPKSSSEWDYVTFDAPGPDGVWGTDDDHPSARAWCQGPVGKPAIVESFSAPGPDQIWGTTDDVIGGVKKYDYGDGASKPYLREWQYTSFGSDGAWGTNDDTVGVLTNRYTGWGNFVYGAGTDGTWGTTDDVVGSHYTDDRNVGGRYQVLALFSGTSNTQTSLAITVCKDGVFDARIFASAGPDATWDTPDDVVQARMRVTGCSCDAMPTSPISPN